MFRLHMSRRARTRFYARLDDVGRCETLWATESSIPSGRWIEVTELNPFWIGRQLPLSARSGCHVDSLTPAPARYRARSKAST